MIFKNNCIQCALSIDSQYKEILNHIIFIIIIIENQCYFKFIKYDQKKKF